MMGYVAPVSDHRMFSTFRGELWDTFSAPYSIVPYPTKWRGHYIGLGRDFRQPWREKRDDATVAQNMNAQVCKDQTMTQRHV